MAQTKRAFEEAKIPFAKMTFSPDVPSTALGPNEYNTGLNIETDVRGIRSVAGDEIILATIPGTPTYVTGGYRRPQPGKEGNDFYYIVATVEGYWYASNGMGDWQVINPDGQVFTTYNQGTNITDSWNGTVPFFNDEANPPMFWPEFTGASLPTTSASSSAGTSTITFPTQNDTLGGVSIVNKDGEFAFNGATTLKVGQRVDISGVNTNANQFGLRDVEIRNNEGEFTFADTSAPAQFIGRIDDGTPPGAGTTLTVSSVSSGVIYNGMELSWTVGAVNYTTKIVSYISGSPVGASVWQVSTSHDVAAGTAFTGALQFALVPGQSVIVSGTNTSTNTVLAGVDIVDDNGNFTCTASTFQAGQSVTVSGTISTTSEVLSSVDITGIAGEFSCAAVTTPLQVGQSVEITGAVTTAPYTLTSPFISGPNATFTCAATTLAVGQVVTVSGTNTNTNNLTMVNLQITGTGGQFTCDDPAQTLRVGQNVIISGNLTGTGGIVGYVNPSTFQVSAASSAAGTTSFTLQKAGAAIVTSVGTTTGLTAVIQSPAIVSYTDPTSYVIIATNGTSTFTLANLDGTPVATRGGSPQNLTFTVEAAEITNYTDPTTYLISATNTSTTFTLTTVDGVPIATRGGDATGLTLTVQAPSIAGYTNPTTYKISTNNGSTAFKLVNLTTGTAIDTTGGSTAGLTFTVLASGISGYTNPTTYYITQTDGSSYFQLQDSAGTVLTTTGGPVSGLTIRPQPPSIVGYSNPSTYYITAVNNNNQFTLSTTPGGSNIATNAGTPVGLTYTYSPFGIGQEILVEGVVPTGFRGLKTVTGVSMSSVSFAGNTAGPQTVAGAVSDPYPKIIPYSNAVPLDLTNIATDPTDTDLQIITLAVEQVAAPYAPGEQIIISDVNNYFNGRFTVVSSTTTTITYRGKPGANYPGGTGTVSALYTWNYNPNWTNLYAKFMRIYNTPNVGSILVAGGLTATSLDGTIEEYPVTVRWSQAFGLNEAPLTWEPTVVNVANELEVPLRGAVVDAFPCNGQLFLSSVWDTVVFSPINYATTSAPILGVRLANQGRGMLSSNCWSNTDKLVYGIDARDIWVFDGQDFRGLGNQRVKNWFFDQLDPAYVDRVFMETNTQKNQVEIYYPTKPPIIESINIITTDGWFSCDVQNAGFSGPIRLGLEVVLSGTESGTGSITGYNPAGTTYYVVDMNAAGDEFQLSTTPTGSGVATTLGTVTGVDFNFVSDGVPNMMLAYRHDLDCFNAPREVQSATLACEGPYFSSQTLYQNVTGTNIVATGSGARFNILRTNSFYEGYPTPNVRGTGYTVGDTILVLGTALGGETPANDAVITVTAVDGPGRIFEFEMTGTPLDTWLYNSGLRTVVYARGLTNRTLVQKDDGYNFLGPQTRPYPVNSLFRRDNIKILEDYSGKLMVHRLLPEINNLSKANVPIMANYQSGNRIGSVSIKVEGANSVGQEPLQTTAETIATNTDYPWVQISQNAHRVNSLELSNSSAENIWICTATTWQYTQTEDDR